MDCLRAMNGTIHAELPKDDIFSLYITKYLTYRKTRKEATETALHIFFLPPQLMCSSVKKEEAGGARSW
jgi:hypothetical protein